MDFQMPKYHNSEPNPAASYPSPRTEAESSSPPPSSPIYVQAPQSVDPLSTSTEYADPMRPKVTDDDLERLEDDARGHDAVLKPKKAPPLPEEHIYVHDPQFPLNLTDFEVMETLGTGTFGRVLLVRLRSTSPHAQPGVQQHFAMKVLRKTEVVRLRQVAHVQAERFILSRIQHPFIVDLYATFSDPFNVYMLLSGKIHWPKEMDHRSKELIKGFLNPDRSKRLGNLRGGADDVLSHDWFRGVDWVALERGEIRAPLIPVVTSSADTRNFTNLPLPDPSDLPGLIPSLTGRLHEIPDPTGDLFANF
ncbi:serine/threonine protein kinase, AGC [Tulasnella sp. 408]|nr:serine/threonine protein kinase, AGC [Tulasnella sp. 408]